MSASPLSAGADMGNHWELSSSASSPRSDTSSNTNSLFSSPDSPTDTEVSFPTTKNEDTEKSSGLAQARFVVTPSFANYVLVGNTPYAPSQVQAMRDELIQARKRGEFPTTTSAVEDPQTIVEDYQHLQRLRSARGDPAIHPPPQQYNIIKVDIARRIKARDEAHGVPANFQEVDHRVQNWMSSINKEARMLEITQAALQRKGINNPTQDDLDAIAEEFMQIAERTLLDVANPLRMNATRMEGNMSRFDSQLDGLSSINDAVNTSMSAQVETLNTVLTNLNKSMNTSMISQLATLNTMLNAQSNNFNGSVGMLNTALNTVNTDLHQITSTLPAMIAAAVQAAVKEQLSAIPHQRFHSKQHQSNYDLPPGYATATRMQQYQANDGQLFGGSAEVVASAVPISGQEYEQSLHMSTKPTKSRFRRFLRVITGRGQSKKEKSSN
ncbi:hypothetical protein CABS01_14848 [Colletotrichum abscissum]|uniref:Uncharacterized protein n=1 Tax=Colletotrichum abscissum TaxID=1671311 RepID=A0A9P9XJC0_9PEZI|nr:uncharacterized protein CABS01_14848 [Colletotrichum abscissum]KAI3555476.1 hypothetical protein CABS02_04232 [Colletotrichum abscissum]KAK1478662.1 hypothetical protein CABS01_14848 [Colletotrichum abscissum]